MLTTNNGTFVDLSTFIPVQLGNHRFFQSSGQEKLSSVDVSKSL
jgi:hypothetical protein